MTSAQQIQTKQNKTVKAHGKGTDYKHFEGLFHLLDGNSSEVQHHLLSMSIDKLGSTFNMTVIRDKRILDYYKASGIKLNVCITHNTVVPRQCCSAWIDIPELFRILHGASKGVKHRILKQAIFDIKDSWDRTYACNTSKDCEKLRNAIKSVNISCGLKKIDKNIRNSKFRKFSTEMFSGVNGLKNTVIETCDDLRYTLGKAQMTLDAFSGVNVKAGNIADRVDRMTEQIEKTINAVREYITSDSPFMPFIVFVVKMLSFAYLLSCPENRTLPKITSLFLIMMPDNVIGLLSKATLSVLSLALKSVMERLCDFGRRFQTLDDAIENDCNIIKSLFLIVKNLTFGCFTDIDKDKFQAMTIQAKKVELLARTLKSVTTIGQYFTKMFTGMLTWINEWCLTQFGVPIWFTKDHDVENLFSSYFDCKRNGLFDKAKMEREAALVVLDLIQKFESLEEDLATCVATTPDQDQSRLLMQVRILLSKLEKVKGDIPPHVRTGVQARRCKPFWLYIHGPPRIGKSSMFQPLLVNEIVARLKLRSKYEDIENFTFYRSVGADWWDRYTGQLVCWYNDIFQNFGDTERVNAAIEELTQVIDDNPYLVNIAKCEDKNSVYFTSNLVVTNAQEDITGKNFISDRCLSGGEHLYNRRNVVVQLNLNQKSTLAEEALT